MQPALAKGALEIYIHKINFITMNYHNMHFIQGTTMEVMYSMPNRDMSITIPSTVNNVLHEYHGYLAIGGHNFL